MNPLRVKRYVRRHELKLRRQAGEFNAGPRRLALREKRVLLGLHPDWGRIGPMEHGEQHHNWSRKRRRNAIRAENKVREMTGENLHHISLKEYPENTHSVTHCGLTREHAVCISPTDHRSRKSRVFFICSDCADQALWRDRESQAV